MIFMTSMYTSYQPQSVQNHRYIHCVNLSSYVNSFSATVVNASDQPDVDALTGA